ncbi:hypothetical protein J4E85_006334 [Alternaria conjuncta]|uniref:uncharacterized protein n=1 Tax=Alternaria conjuncta TaxID=181017 RepID=UPI002220526F|nr:uncharacterized protein J4E85_006334 [Alternaria conjuncta]KAI4927822.1 hypothetical protein J4E85_006334 [Alternaria conjuncta]
MADPTNVSLPAGRIWNEAASDVDGQDALYHDANNSYPESDIFVDFDGHVAHLDSCTSYFSQDAAHSGFVSLGDIELDNTLGVAVTATQPLQSLFDGGDVQDENVFDGHAKVQNGQVPSNTGLHANMSARSSYAQPVSMSFADDNVTCSPATNTGDINSWPWPFDPGYSTPDSNQDTETQVYQHPAANPARQEAFSASGLQEAAMPKRKGRRYHAQRHQYSTSEQQPVAPQQISSCPSFQEPENRFPCTVCVKAFKNASDWKRHEASVHGYNDREWVCMLTDAFKLQSECVFCLESMDSIDHLDKHAIDPCSNKCTAERSFPRKDLLKQHVFLAHLADAPPPIKKRFEVPKEWSRSLIVSPGGPGSCWCGFCGCMLETTAKRMDHVAQHFREGQNITSWIRMESVSR